MSDSAGLARWSCADGRVLTELELKIYARSGIEPPDAVRWADAGIEPYAAGNFRAAGLSLADAAIGHEAGLSFTEVSRLRAAGFDLAHASEWLSFTPDVDDIPWARANGIGPDEFRPIGEAFAALRASGVPNSLCRQWHDEGQPLSELVAVMDHGLRGNDEPEPPLGFEELSRLLDAGLDLPHVCAWLAVTWNVDDILWARAKGLVPNEFQPVGGLFILLRDLGVPDDTCRGWHDAGEPLVDLAEVIRSGVEVGDATAELPWARAFSDEAERELWRFACESPGLAGDAASRGLRPADVLLAPPGAVLRHLQVTLIVDPAAPRLRRADGEPLPNQLEPFETLEPDTDKLRALGFEVLIEDRRTRFADETTSGLLLVLADFTTLDELRRVRIDEAGRALLESPAPDGSGRLIAASTSVSEALSHVAGLLDQTDTNVVAVTSPDRDPETIRGDLQPLAARHRGKQVRVQESLRFESVLSSDGEWTFIQVERHPVRPAFSIRVRWSDDDFTENQSFISTDIEKAVAFASANRLVVESIACDYEELGVLLETLAPFAQLDPYGAVDVNGVTVVAARTISGGWGFVPEDPQVRAIEVFSADASWLPGGPVVFDQRETIWRVGDFYWAEAQGDATTESVIAGSYGFRDEAIAAAVAASTYCYLTESGQVGSELDDWGNEE